LHGAAPQECDENVERQRVMARLSRPCACDSLTIGTLTSADTIPLGTDLDPMNGYCNFWAANKVQEPIERLLVQRNLGYRVIDAENVGFSYGKEVLRLDKKYEEEGVRRAVAYFVDSGIRVVIVTKRAELKAEARDGVDVVLAERTDDIMVARQAQRLNCPMVSRDGFGNCRWNCGIGCRTRPTSRCASPGAPAGSSCQTSISPRSCCGPHKATGVKGARGAGPTCAPPTVAIPSGVGLGTGAVVDAWTSGGKAWLEKRPADSSLGISQF